MEFFIPNLLPTRADALIQLEQNCSCVTKPSFSKFSLRDNVEDVGDIKTVNVVDYVVVEVGQGSGSLKLIKSEIQLYLETF